MLAECEVPEEQCVKAAWWMARNWQPPFLQGGDIPDGSGGFVQPLALPTGKDCCQACQGLPACGAYVYSTSEQKCFLKVGAGRRTGQRGGLPA